MMYIVPESGRIELCEHLKRIGATRGAEIGVWAGEFSEMLCSLVPGLHLTCVDPWKAYSEYTEKKNDQPRLDMAYQATLRRLAPFPHRILRMTSLEAAALIPNGSLDFFYLDANHAKPFVKEDLEAWTPKVRSGGIIAGHDYEPKGKHPHIEVKAAVDEFMEEHQIPEGFVLTKQKAPSFYWVNP